MRNIVLSSIAALALVGTASLANAQPPLQATTLDTPGTTKTLHLPPAAEHADVISLGTAIDPVSGKKVEGFALFHHRDNHGGGPPGGGSDGDGGGKNQCFELLAKDAKWKEVEPWVLNPDNSEGLGDTFLLGNLGDSIAKWEDAADGSLDGTIGADILGDGSLTNTVLVADTESPDGDNEVYFADVSSSGAIAVTIVWGIFNGPPFQRELVEWDMVFDDVDFDWSSTGTAGTMDFENIATHELGHAVGLGHPDDTCTEETMYSFADTGETKKRTLEAGDVAGSDTLY